MGLRIFFVDSWHQLAPSDRFQLHKPVVITFVLFQCRGLCFLPEFSDHNLEHLASFANLKDPEGTCISLEY